MRDNGSLDVCASLGHFTSIFQVPTPTPIGTGFVGKAMAGEVAHLSFPFREKKE
jgi:hypothetical protein